MSSKNKSEKEPNPKCIHCKIGDTKKHGIRNNVQRYRCKKCGRTFKDPRANDYKYERNERRIISVLLYMLEQDFWNETDLNEAFARAINNTEKYYKLAKGVRFDTQYMKYKNFDGFKIDCFKPKLLISSDDKYITITQIPPFKYEKNDGNENNNNFNAEYKQRTITIIDNKGHENMKIINQHLVDYINIDN